MAAVFFVRHAKAGDRQEWDRPDHLRPLSKKGRKQAEGLADLLSDHSVQATQAGHAPQADDGISRVLSSPFVRCVQTVQPLADRLALKVEETDALAEGTEADEVVNLARDLAREGNAVLCTHGDVIPTLLDSIARLDGLALLDGYPCAKGSTWKLEADASGRFVKAEYLPAPS